MSRVALIADIHGNAVALEAVLADIERRDVDEIVCLGDVAAGGPQPREALRRLRALGCPVVRGNADDWLLGETPADGDEDGHRLRAIVDWARAQLGDADLAYLESFAPTVALDLDASRRLLCFHGSPRASSDRLLATTPEHELARLFAGIEAEVFAGGHTHLQLARRFGTSLLVNPGSVGLPLHGGNAPSSCVACRWTSRRSSGRGTPRGCPIRTGGRPGSSDASPAATPKPPTADGAEECGSARFFRARPRSSPTSASPTRSSPSPPSATGRPRCAASRSSPPRASTRAASRASRSSRRCARRSATDARSTRSTAACSTSSNRT